jgi:hypothetical protein
MSNYQSIDNSEKKVNKSSENKKDNQGSIDKCDACWFLLLGFFVTPIIYLNKNIKQVNTEDIIDVNKIRQIHKDKDKEKDSLWDHPDIVKLLNYLSWLQLLVTLGISLYVAIKYENIQNELSDMDQLWILQLIKIIISYICLISTVNMESGPDYDKDRFITLELASNITLSIIIKGFWPLSCLVNLFITILARLTKMFYEKGRKLSRRTAKTFDIDSVPSNE